MIFTYSTTHYLIRLWDQIKGLFRYFTTKLEQGMNASPVSQYAVLSEGLYNIKGILTQYAVLSEGLYNIKGILTQYAVLSEGLYNITGI